MPLFDGAGGIGPDAREEIWPVDRDWNMESMNGRELVRKIRADPDLA
jgi:CheY-like chemotaxis protein